MSATAWMIIAIIGFSLSGIALVISIFIFIKLNIPAVIGDLSGKTVAREIKAMRDANASSGDKRHKPSKVNEERGQLTEKAKQVPLSGSIIAAAHASKRLDKTGSGKSSGLSKQEIGSTDVLVENATDVLSESSETEVLSASQETEVLSNSQETEVLSQAQQQTEVLTEAQETEVLSENVGEGTTVLSENEYVLQEETVPVAFTVTRSIIKIHTDEVIL